MTRQNIAIILLLALIAGTVIYARSVNINLPGVDQGYAPPQPIAFSHRLHSGDLQIRCLYCHDTADKSRHAGIPPAATCMNCHRFVTASWDKVKIAEQEAKKENRELRIPVADELKKLYDAVGFNTATMKYDPSRTPRPIQWIRVHALPDFVYFDHRRHVNAGVTCQRCHGPVETMERVAQVSDLTMGWCVNCHRAVNSGRIPELQGRYASTSCGVCHF